MDNWETMRKDKAKRHARAIVSELDDDKAEQYRVKVYRDPVTGERIIRLLPVKGVMTP